MGCSSNKNKGFTLVELMIVVSILGILAMIAIPKFADLVRKAQEGKIRAQLANIRSALSIYYSDSDGIPALDIMILIDRQYISEVEQLVIPPFTQVNNPGHNENDNDEVNISEFSSTTDNGSWQYINENTSVNWGHFYISCNHNDSKSIIWNNR